MVDDDPASIDCGSCRHYHQFPGSLLGVCNNEKRRKKRARPQERPEHENQGGDDMIRETTAERLPRACPVPGPAARHGAGGGRN